MTQTRQTIREAVGVLPDTASLEAAIDDLQSAGFDRAEISLLATQEALERSDGRLKDQIEELEDDPNAPRASYASQESLGAGEGGLIGGFAYVPAVTAAGVVVLSGGAMAPAIAAAVGAGGAGAAIGAVLARWLGRHHGENLEQQMERGGLLLWVRTRDAEREQRAKEILSRHDARDVHVHEVPAEGPETIPGV